MLGTDLCAAAQGVGHQVTGFGHGTLDISNVQAVAAAVRESAPDVVINCAAWTDVDGAESAFDSAMRVNAGGAGNVARAATAAGAWTVHVSSDYVFDGSKREPYVESDDVGPLSAYGRSKLEGELAVADGAPSCHTIVRSSWLFGVAGRCFPASILAAARTREELTVVDDQVGCPTFTGHLARALIELAQACVPGVLHVAGAGSCSWYEFAREIVEQAGLACDVVPGRTVDLGRPAPRPAYSVLGTERPAQAPRLPDWRGGLEEYMSSAVRS